MIRVLAKVATNHSDDSVNDRRYNGGAIIAIKMVVVTIAMIVVEVTIMMVVVVAMTMIIRVVVVVRQR